MVPARYKPFDAKRTRLDGNVAFHMALCSEFVYYRSAEHWPDRTRMLKDLQGVDDRYRDIHAYKRGPAECAVIDHENYIVIAFAGTNEGRDWLSNLDMFAVQRYGDRMHKGFSDCFERLKEDITLSLNTLANTDPRPIYITGHSLGGAIAVCCAAYFNYLDKPFHGLYTFGAPRCLERETAIRFDVLSGRRAFRFQNSLDVVTRIPARIAGYSHVGQTLFIDESKQIQTDPGFWSVFLDALRVVAGDVFRLDISAIADHDIKDYRMAIDDWDLNL